MAEATQTKTNLKSLRQKNLLKETSIKEDKPYYYPKQNLYTRQEFELLDTIYSIDTPAEHIKDEEITFPVSKDKKNDFTRNLMWFFYGVTLTSILWFVFYEFRVHEIMTKDNTKIIYHKTAELMTDKTVDKAVVKTLKKEITETGENLLAIHPVPAKKEPFWNKWFKQKPKAKQTVTAGQPSIQTVGFHVVRSGDSLWSIANKYYSNPSPENINKIAKANKLKLTSSLQPGQKLVIPE